MIEQKYIVRTHVNGKCYDEPFSDKELAEHIYFSDHLHSALFIDKIELIEKADGIEKVIKTKNGTY